MNWNLAGRTFRSVFLLEADRRSPFIGCIFNLRMRLVFYTSFRDFMQPGNSGLHPTAYEIERPESNVEAQ